MFRKYTKIAILYILFPLVIILGSAVFKDKLYAYVIMAAVILTIGLCFVGFENKKTKTLILILISVMTVLSVAGRMIPFVKPVTAIVIESGIFLGPLPGFITGAMSAVISNVYFGQGPWTPFQMFALGMIGLIGGLLGPKLTKSKVILVMYGILSGILYSAIMDIWTVLWYSNSFSIGLYLTAAITAIPHTVIYIVSNVIFLNLFTRPLERKISRIRYKY